MVSVHLFRSFRSVEGLALAQRLQDWGGRIASSVQPGRRMPTPQPHSSSRCTKQGTRLLPARRHAVLGTFLLRRPSVFRPADTVGAPVTSISAPSPQPDSGTKDYHHGYRLWIRQP